MQKQDRKKGKFFIISYLCHLFATDAFKESNKQCQHQDQQSQTLGIISTAEKGLCNVHKIVWISSGPQRPGEICRRLMKLFILFSPQNTVQWLLSDWGSVAVSLEPETLHRRTEEYTLKIWYIYYSHDPSKCTTVQMGWILVYGQSLLVTDLNRGYRPEKKKILIWEGEWELSSTKIIL